MRPTMRILLLALAALGGCPRASYEPPFTDGSSPLEAGPTCSSWTCAGCCAGGQCRPGRDPASCGSGGKACVACQAKQSCPAGSCIALASCGPASCPDGCCDSDVCRGGDDARACGKGGAACQACPAGKACLAKACSETCSGGIARPLAASSLFGVTCNPGASLAADGVFAGLDRAALEMSSIGGKEMASCIAVDFGSVQQLDSVVVRAKAVDKACAIGCSSCGTGRRVAVLHSELEAAGSYKFVAAPEITATVADYTVTIAGQARYVAVCREAYGPERDDVTVDSVHALCH
jgi:hypothetical protein